MTFDDEPHSDIDVCIVMASNVAPLLPETTYDQSVIVTTISKTFSKAPSFRSTFVPFSPSLIDVVFNKDSTDVTLIASDGEHIPCHRSILTHYSSVFKTKLANENTHRVEFPINDFDSKVIKTALKWIYGNPADLSCSGVFECACKYDCEKLRVVLSLLFSF